MWFDFVFSCVGKLDPVAEQIDSATAIQSDNPYRRMTIRWKRGFFRAWIVFAVLWIACVALIQSSPSTPSNSYYKVNPHNRSGCEEIAKTYPSYDVEACVRAAVWDNANGKLTWMFLPPVLILIVACLIAIVTWVFGSVLAWIIRGFRP